MWTEWSTRASISLDLKADCKGGGMGEASFVKILRSGLLDALDLIREHRPAFLLLFYIAMRARRTPTNIANLGIGEVKIGSNSLASQLGLTEGEYRTAKKKLEQAELVTFRATNWGTVAKLLSTGIFDPNFSGYDGPNDRQETEPKRPDNSQMTTNKNEQEKKEKKIGSTREVLPYGDLVKKELGVIIADHELLAQWEQAYPGVNIRQQVLQAQSWLLANPEKKKKNFKKFLVNWLANASRSNIISNSRPVSQEFSLKMHLEFQKELEKLMHEKETIEASLAASQGIMAKKRLEEQLSIVNNKICELKTKKL